MKKQDLESGMVVSFKDWKEKFILIQDALCCANGKDFLMLDSYDDDLQHNYNDNFDIVEVYKCEYPNLMSCFIEGKLELIWKREEVEKEVEYEDYRQAVEFDKDLCTTIAMEECSELIQAISKAKRGKLDKENMAEEIADVIICLDWISKAYDIADEEIVSWLIMKENRIVERLNTGEFK